MSVLSGHCSWYAAVGMKRRDIDGLLHGWQEAIATCKMQAVPHCQHV